MDAGATVTATSTSGATLWARDLTPDADSSSEASGGGLAYAGFPVTHREVNQSVTFVTGHDHTGQTPSALDWDGIARGSQMIVVYMGMKHVGEIAAKLIAAGRSAEEPAAVVVSASTPQQRVLDTTLGRMEADIAASGLEPPAILCIGEGVRMRHALDWQSLALGMAPAMDRAMGQAAMAAG